MKISKGYARVFFIISFYLKINSKYVTETIIGNYQFNSMLCILKLFQFLACKFYICHSPFNQVHSKIV